MTEADLLASSCASCAMGAHENCRPSAPGACGCREASHVHDRCREPVGGKRNGPCGAPVAEIIEAEGAPAHRKCKRHAKAERLAALKDAHAVVYGRFSRGMTPIAPRRTLYGATARCRCGWSTRTNEAQAEAVRRYRAHLAEVIAAASDPGAGGSLSGCAR